MSKCTIIAKLSAAEGKADELKAALLALIEAVEEEPGCEIYSLHADPNAEGVFHFFELYSDEQALTAHGKGEKMSVAMGALGGLLGDAPEIYFLDPIAAYGIDL